MTEPQPPRVAHRNRPRTQHGKAKPTLSGRPRTRNPPASGRARKMPLQGRPVNITSPALRAGLKPTAHRRGRAQQRARRPRGRPPLRPPHAGNARPRTSAGPAQLTPPRRTPKQSYTDPPANQTSHPARATDPARAHPNGRKLTTTHLFMASDRMRTARALRVRHGVLRVSARPFVHRGNAAHARRHTTYLTLSGVARARCVNKNPNSEPRFDENASPTPCHIALQRTSRGSNHSTCNCLAVPLHAQAREAGSRLPVLAGPARNQTKTY